jgi:hypothetical protein
VGEAREPQKSAFSRKAGSSEALWPLAELLWHAGGCPLMPKSAIESHLGFAGSFRVHEPISTSQFAAVAALPPRNNSLRYTVPLRRDYGIPPVSPPKIGVYCQAAIPCGSSITEIALSKTIVIRNKMLIEGFHVRPILCWNGNRLGETGPSMGFDLCDFIPLTNVVGSSPLLWIIWLL